jgi:hypothetical protein
VLADLFAGIPWQSISQSVRREISVRLKRLASSFGGRHCGHVDLLINKVCFQFGSSDETETATLYTPSVSSFCLFYRRQRDHSLRQSLSMQRLQVLMQGPCQRNDHCPAASGLRVSQGTRPPLESPWFASLLTTLAPLLLCRRSALEVRNRHTNRCPSQMAVTTTYVRFEPTEVAGT